MTLERWANHVPAVHDLQSPVSEWPSRLGAEASALTIPYSMVRGEEWVIKFNHCRDGVDYLTVVSLPAWIAYVQDDW
jgi:hypothetical protein